MEDQRRFVRGVIWCVGLSIPVWLALVAVVTWWLA